MFSCESDGYEAVVFGAFDGITSWTNNAYIDLGPVHQEVVRRHEERHLRLQKGTPWGALLLLLALSGDSEGLPTLVDACRQTHESYATYLSTARVEDGLRTLEHNPAYLGYRRSAAAIADAFDREAPVSVILEYLYHLVMSPAALSDAMLAGDHLALLNHGPDQRLAGLTKLLRTTPELAAEIASTIVSSAHVADVQDTLAGLLGDHGLPTLSTAEQLAHASRFMSDFNTTSTTHRVQVADRSRATSLTDQLDYQQHEILAVHRERVQLRVGAPPMHEGAAHPLADWLRHG